MYPGVIIEYDDQSSINQLPVTEVRNKPLFAALFTSDKGVEEWTRISGADFFDMYGKNISFNRHGQPLLQAAMSINAGAELLCKRLVADDATLANIGIVASLTDGEVQKVNDEGMPLYTGEDGNETTVVTDKPIMVAGKLIKYSLKSAASCKTAEEAHTSIKADLAEGEYLLYVICDNGRGKSKKRVKIIPNYRLSKSLEYTQYTLSVLEGAETDESITFSVNPNLVVSGQNVSLHSMINTNSKQISCVEDESGMESFVSALAEATGLDADVVYSYDPLFACTNRGLAMPNVAIDTTGIDLQHTYGQMLQNGSNGEFGDYPIQNEEAFVKSAVAALDGTFDTTIFNVDQYRIDAIVDANYPTDVKRAIEALAVFREDFIYFRDQGLGVTSLETIVEKSAKETKTMFVTGSYPQSYDVIDPYTKKQITVTMGYSLAQLLVSHINNGRNLPTAGMKHNMVITDAIYGTLSFAPTICPDPIGNQKEKLDDMHINYASYIDNQLVIESLYTSQDKITQWSYINNVMSIQEVVKSIRARCPAIRYTFVDGEDLEKYRADVEEIIAPYRSNFKTLELVYAEDATYTANKIFYAVLKVVYKDFIQTEWFKVTALSAVEVVNA